MWIYKCVKLYIYFLVCFYKCIAGGRLIFNNKNAKQIMIVDVSNGKLFCTNVHFLFFVSTQAEYSLKSNESVF